MGKKHPEARKRFDELKEKDDSHSIKKQLDEIQLANERSQKHEPIDIDTLREELKFFMAEKDLTIQNMADRIKRNPRTVWQFLNEKVKPSDRTVYKIREFLRRTKKNQLPPKIKEDEKIANIKVTLAQILRHLLEKEKRAKGGNQKETKEGRKFFSTKRMQKPKFLTLKETADYLHCSTSLLYKKTATRKIPHVRIGRKILFELPKLERFIEENSIKVRY